MDPFLPPGEVERHHGVMPEVRDLSNHGNDATARLAEVGYDKVLRTQNEVDGIALAQNLPRRRTGRHLAKGAVHHPSTPGSRHDDRTADEAREPPTRRLLIYLLRRAELNQPPGIEDGDEVGYREGLVLIMGHEHRRHSRPAEHTADLGAKFLSKRGVESREGLVEKDKLGPDCQGAGKSDPMPLTATEFSRHSRRQFGEPDHFEQFPCPPAAALASGEPERYVVQDVHMREQGGVLGNQTNTSSFWRNVDPWPGYHPSTDDDRSLDGLEEARNDTQKCGLPRAGRPEHSGESTVRNREGNPIEDRKSLVPGDDLADLEFAHVATHCLGDRLGPRRASRVRKTAGTAATITRASA